MQGLARLAQAVRDHSMEWKKIPASDARLLAMAGRIALEDRQEYLGDMEKSLKSLDKDERETFEKFRKISATA